MNEMSDLSPKDREYLIELLAAGDLDGLKAFKENSKPTPIKFYCRVMDGEQDDILYDQYGILLSHEETQELNKPQECSGNSKYLPQISSIIICYTSPEQMKLGLIDQYGTK